MDTFRSLPTPSSLDLRETARRLAMLEAEGIPSEDGARAVANVAAWLHAMADAQDLDGSSDGGNASSEAQP